MDEFKNNRELLKYCFLMQEYRSTQKKNRELDLQDISDSPQASVNIKMLGDLKMAFSIENNVSLWETCRLVENPAYLEIRLSNNFSPNSQNINSFKKYTGLIKKIDGERICT